MENKDNFENRDKFAGSYTQLSKGKISDRRSVVVSKRSDGAITVAQQLETDEGKRKTAVFLKGTFHVHDLEGLKNFREALDEAIKALESDRKEYEWDDELGEVGKGRGTVSEAESKDWEAFWTEGESEDEDDEWIEVIKEVETEEEAAKASVKPEEPSPVEEKAKKIRRPFLRRF